MTAADRYPLPPCAFFPKQPEPAADTAAAAAPADAGVAVASIKLAVPAAVSKAGSILVLFGQKVDAERTQTVLLCSALGTVRQHHFRLTACLSITSAAMESMHCHVNAVPQQVKMQLCKNDKRSCHVLSVVLVQIVEWRMTEKCSKRHEGHLLVGSLQYERLQQWDPCARVQLRCHPEKRQSTLSANGRV